MAFLRTILFYYNIILKYQGFFEINFLEIILIIYKVEKDLFFQSITFTSKDHSDQSTYDSNLLKWKIKQKSLKISLKF